MAGFGVLWRVFDMGKYTDYAYCSKCDKPLRAHEFRFTYESNGLNSYSCQLCGSNARGFNCIAGIPRNLIMLAMLLLMPPFLAFAIEPSAGVDMEFLSIFYMAMLFPAFLFLLMHYWGKSKCKPVYDRWVMRYGTDPDKWPGASKLYRTPKPPKWADMSTQQKNSVLVAVVAVALLVVVILVSALFLYDDYKSGLF